MERSSTTVFVAVAVAAAVTLGAFAVFVFSYIPPPPTCDLPAPPIWLRTVSGSGELVFLSEYSTYHPQPLVSDLDYELAGYQPGDDLFGSGSVFRAGPLSSLNATGTFQFHDMAAEGEFSPGNDFFILLNPPTGTTQLRILNETGAAIAWNSIVGCV